jgi:hypothetical protein
MSAQSYTNKRRILAEISVVKTQYKKGVSVNNNAMYASINCLPDFQQITYAPVCTCPFNGRGTVPRAPPIVDIDGGNAQTGVEDVLLWLDGGSA